MQNIKKIGTHSGAFHVDEVLACAMLTRYTHEFMGGEITRTRDPLIWQQQDILVDVGGEYIPNQHKYDHHQREFQDTFSGEYTIRLSSAGLIYKHFGKEVLENTIKKIQQTSKLTIEIEKLDGKSFDLIYQKLYKNFIQSIDAIDNGINQYPKPELAKYQINTHLAAVINRFNPNWCEIADDYQRFKEAIDFVDRELIEQVKAIYLGWYPGRQYVLDSINNRLQIYQSGEIIKLNKSLPWKSHLYEIEKEMKIEGEIKFVLYPDQDEGWRVQAIGINQDSFESRIPLQQQWRGIKDLKQLQEISGIVDIVFVHASGFIGGAKSYESALRMAVQSL